MLTELQEIMEITHTDVNVCACEECIGFCKKAPCLGTPTDILNIVKAGHINKIAYTKWAAGLKQGIPILSMVQPLFDKERGCCSFLDQSQKRCTLHDAGLKPTEGKLSNHMLGTLGVQMGVNLPIAHAVALTWVDDKNMSVVMEIINELQIQIKKNNTNP